MVHQIAQADWHCYDTMCNEIAEESVNHVPNGWRKEFHFQHQRLTLRKRNPLLFLFFSENSPMYF